MLRPRRSEYLVLRRTIAARGSLRAVLLVAGIAIWAVILTAVFAWIPYPVAAVVPLLVLVATFEAIRPLHFGAERIGRYLQVFYEEAGQPERPLADTPSWERVAMRLGKVPGVGGHPLFVPVFVLATITNYLAVIVPGPVPVETAALAVPHAAMLWWLFSAHRAMRSQRELELQEFRRIHQQEE